MAEVPRAVEIALVVASAAMFIGTIVGLPWFIRRLPADHFVRPPRAHALGTKVLRNIGGVVLIGLGVAMLVLPGQGIVTIVLGLSILDLQVKHRVLRWLLGQPKIQEGVQRIRSRAGKPPLIIPAHPVY